MTRKLLLLPSLLVFAIGMIFSAHCESKADSPRTGAKGKESRFVVGLRAVSSNPKDENTTIFSTPGGDVIVPILHEFNAYGWSDNEDLAREAAATMAGCIPKEFTSIVKVEIKLDANIHSVLKNTWYPEGTANIHLSSEAVPFAKLKQYLSECGGAR